jgi:uncharacterized protein YyaL (SSP411 family)
MASLVKWAPLMLALLLTGCPDHPGNGQVAPSRVSANNLAGESSPYLLQHLHNPVDWYPWRDDAFEKARKENKPIFLSVGYSACHWCHVMERESFENEDIAKILNKDFVSIKVDREERPDVDDLYMTAVQMLNRSGGWPMSVWLTPDGKPLYGATYFPPDRFKQVLGAIAEAWRNKRPEIDKSASSIAEAVKLQLRVSSASATMPGNSVLAEVFAELKSEYDTKNGGFGRAPKFPPHNTLPLLFFLHEHAGNKNALAPALGTLDAMALGGIRDHLGGGFHRYSTDAVWLVPHFEKMLYDNALLARAYTEAFQITGKPLYKRVSMETLDWALREMRGPEGGFYSTLDADSEGVEGKYYLWKHSEVLTILGKADAKQFCEIYGVAEDGNYAEQATGQKNGTNILHLRWPFEYFAKERGRLPFVERLPEMRAKLLAARSKRIRPGLDDKRLTSWNGLMISALSKAGEAFHEPRYIQAAAQAADYVLTPLLRDGKLVHSRRPTPDAQHPPQDSPAFLEDYAYLMMGFLDLYEAQHSPSRFSQARAVADAMLQHLADTSGGFYDSSASDKKLFARAKSGFDSAMPSPNGVAARALIRLGKATGDGKYRGIAVKTIKSFGGLITRAPRGTQTLLLASAEYDQKYKAQVKTPVLPAMTSKGPVTLSAECNSAMPGLAAELRVRIAVQPQWHINSTAPLDKSLIASQLTIEPPVGFTASTPTFPAPKHVRLGFSKDELSVFQNEVIVTANLMSPRDAKLGPNSRVIVRLRYQACNNKACLAPETLAISVPITVTRR